MESVTASSASCNVHVGILWNNPQSVQSCNLICWMVIYDMVSVKKRWDWNSLAAARALHDHALNGVVWTALVPINYYHIKGSIGFWAILWLHQVVDPFARECHQGRKCQVVICLYVRGSRWLCKTYWWLNQDQYTTGQVQSRVVSYHHKGLTDDSVLGN